jgi:thiosulfate/3-mercaptopyruvate sulfurtransferase
MAATLGRLGITTSVQVVAYDQDSGVFASRLWWMLRYMGHREAAVLDGGWARWSREGRAAHQGEERRPPAVFRGSAQKTMRVDVDEAREAVNQPNVLLVDARAPERFEGKTEPLDRVAGHIPGAVNHFYKLNVTDRGEMLPADALRAQFAAVMGERSPAQVVMYCGSGVSACHNLLAMEHAGLTGSKLYPGSWSEWTSDPARPVERGAGGSSGQVEK